MLLRFLTPKKIDPMTLRGCNIGGERGAYWHNQRLSELYHVGRPPFWLIVTALDRNGYLPVLSQGDVRRRFAKFIVNMFLAATKQLYDWFSPSVRLSVCPSVCLSVCPSHLFDYVPIIVSSWNFQEISPRYRVRSMQKVKVRGQRSRSQRSQPYFTVSGL